MTKVIVAGSRLFNDYNFVEIVLTKLLSTLSKVEIVSGRCNYDLFLKTGQWIGADMMGERYANQNNLPVKPFPPNWNTYGKAAGPIRNEQMAIYADWCMLFWDGKSKGSASMKKMCTKHNVTLFETIITL